MSQIEQLNELRLKREALEAKIEDISFLIKRLPSPEAEIMEAQRVSLLAALTLVDLWVADMEKKTKEGLH